MKKCSRCGAASVSDAVWIVGKRTGNPWRESMTWEFQGVFSDREAAIAACRSDAHFVGPAVMDCELPDEETPWDGACYPMLEYPTQEVKP